MHTSRRRITLAVCVFALSAVLLWRSIIHAIFLPRSFEVLGVGIGAILISLPILLIRKPIIVGTTTILMLMLSLFPGAPYYNSWSTDFDAPTARSWIARKFHTSKERVQSLDIDLSSTNAESALWDIFLSHPVAVEQPIPSLSALDSESIKRTEELFAAAKKAGLDHESLHRAWSAIIREKDPEMVLMPTAAFLIKYEGRPAWAITCDWEYRSLIDTVNGASNPGPINLGHVRVWVRDATTTEQLVFTTCS